MTPGLVDIHVHVYTGTGERSSYAGDNSVPPDGFTFRSGVTTVADAGSSGWRNFADFKDRIIDRSKTRVLAFLNIVGNGMRGGKFEQDQADMDAHSAAAQPRMRSHGRHHRHQDRPLHRTRMDSGGARGRGRHGSAHTGDGGLRHLCPLRPYQDLVLKKLRPGDISTHMYLDRRPHARRRAASCCPTCSRRGSAASFSTSDTAAGSFLFRQAVPAIRQGWIPDSISTDLHIGSMNGGMKDMLNVMSKFLNMGMTLDDVVLRSTWTPAREIHREELGHLSPGAPADVAVLRLEKGELRIHRRQRRPHPRLAEANLRAHGARWPGGVGPQRHQPRRLEHPG